MKKSTFNDETKRRKIKIKYKEYIDLAKEYIYKANEYKENSASSIFQVLICHIQVFFNAKIMKNY